MCDFDSLTASRVRSLPRVRPVHVPWTSVPTTTQTPDPDTTDYPCLIPAPVLSELRTSVYHKVLVRIGSTRTSCLGRIEGGPVFGLVSRWTTPQVRLPVDSPHLPPLPSRLRLPRGRSRGDFGVGTPEPRTPVGTTPEFLPDHCVVTESTWSLPRAPRGREGPGKGYSGVGAARG